MAAGETASVPVEAWSAEAPRLYRGTLRSPGETIELAIGFRRIEIVDGVFIVNGRPVTFRGVNRHEHHPDTGRTLDRATMLQDILMMKRANIDAVRTSHYPPHPEFLRLCDEYGLWVVVECDLETHGFIYAGWEGNPPAMEEWRGALLDRMKRTVERDKNRPSVVIWSMANESGSGDAFAEMERWIRHRDPSRPVLYERDPSYRNSDFYSLMYPSLEDLDRIGRREEPAPEGITEDEDARRRALPFLLIEYAHAMGNGPGSLQEYGRIMAAHERICGGFVWEWIDHGFHATIADGTGIVMHGEDVAYSPSGGRFSLHGLVFSDRTPTPGLTELAKAYAPISIRVGLADRDREPPAHRRHLRSRIPVVDRRRRRHGGGGSALGAIRSTQEPERSYRCLTAWPPLRAGATGEVVLSVEAVLVDATSWAPAGHVIAWGQSTLAEAAVRPDEGDRAATAGRRGGEVSVGPATFDAASGRLLRLGDLDLDGPWLDLHRAPTENDHGQGALNDIAAVWTATGLDRLLHRTDSVEVSAEGLSVRGRTAPTTHPHGVEWEMRWRPSGDGVELAVSVDFTGPWADTPYLHRDIWVPRMGLLFALPAIYSRVEWFGRGPGETYADSYEGSRIGRFASSIDGLQVPYPVPQENGNHVHTRWLEVSGDGMPTLRVEGSPTFDFTARRWTSLDLQQARKPHELRDSGRVWLNIDERQQGIGSASVGPALPEAYRVPREAHLVASARVRPLIESLRRRAPSRVRRARCRRPGRPSAAAAVRRLRHRRTAPEAGRCSPRGSRRS